jgi:diguanylate cyclase (GGDEF)-like protein/PAS domain S-box-containing protein
MIAAYRPEHGPSEHGPAHCRAVPDEPLIHALPILDDHQQFRSAFDDAAIAMSLATLNFRLLRVNQAHCEMLGYTEHELLTTDFRTRIHPDDLGSNDDLRAALFSGEIDSYATERRYFHRDGHIVWCIVTVRLVRDEHGHPRYFVGQMQDISERKHAEAALRANQQRMLQVLASSSDGILIVDRAGVITMANAAIERISGLPAAQLTGRSCQTLEWSMRPADGQRYPGDVCPLVHALATGLAVTGIEVRFGQDGTDLVYGVVDAVPLTDHDGQLDGVVLTIHDITRQKLLEQRLEHLAQHDALTGLPNRRLFEQQAERALHDVRDGAPSAAILFVDLDDFKPVNDQHGHAAGDRVLIELAQRLVECVGDDGIVARMGGDEFAILLRNAPSIDALPSFEQRILSLSSAPYRVNGCEVVVTPSVGSGLLTCADDRLGDVLHRADSAMYRSKRMQRAHRQRQEQSSSHYWKWFGMHQD